MSRPAPRLASVRLPFASPLIPGRLIRRYKRFLADVRLESGEKVLAHCPNSGSMLGCLGDDAPVYLSKADNPARRTAYTWEMIYLNHGWIGINTMLPNRLAELAAQARAIRIFAGARSVRREVKVGAHTRLDMVVERKKGPLYVEVKNVTLVQEGVARFPDAVTTRGAKHLETLMELKRQGADAAMFYLVQRSDARAMGPAQEIDPEYARLFHQARSRGIELVAVEARVTPQEISLVRRLPMVD
ncbi:MAG: DNA/RNA nuclease SfsA [Desulfarculaceae bacterium]|nr:DNA/RNA nuclease SfsA [Desulfarculaceae bacterium]MCF8071385.1 DNA/RNA nuclease SfsA [Desulfarculaceae bacterium]MCF8101710.1 DNA/RNA nuclease SfsA [Desulfarculaceae bacterium]MCF8116681.1 DNA/RNA nuclease SfsA [Desulfarculaceae bacterium]